MDALQIREKKFRKGRVYAMNVHEGDQIADLNSGKRCTLDFLSLAVVVVDISKVSCLRFYDEKKNASYGYASRLQQPERAVTCGALALQLMLRSAHRREEALRIGRQPM